MNLEINIRALFGDMPIYLVSGSAAELGPDAGDITWRNALTLAELSSDVFAECDLDEIRYHMRAYGAWNQDEIAAWTDRDVRARAIQEIAADWRAQVEHDAAPEDVRHALSEDGLTMHCYFGN